MQREADVIEEILRVYGYNNIGYGTKLNASIANVNKIEDYQIQNKIAEQLVGQGFTEMMANSLTTPNYVDLDEDLTADNNVNIINPLSNDLSVMRQSLLFSGLEAIAYNINRKNADLKLFEFGKTYHKEGEDLVEYKHLSLFVTGNQTPENWIVPQMKGNFFYLKAIINTIFERLGISKLQSAPTDLAILQEGIKYTQGKNTLVEFGIVNAKVAKKLGVSQQVLFADFNWSLIIDNLKAKKIKVTDIPKFLPVRRDFALLLNNSVSYKDIYDLAFKQERKLLKEVNLFDVYEGDKLPEGKKSYAVSFTLLDDNKTLADKQIDKIMKKLQQSFEKELGAELR